MRSNAEISIRNSINSVIVSLNSVDRVLPNKCVAKFAIIFATPNSPSKYMEFHIVMLLEEECTDEMKKEFETHMTHLSVRQVFFSQN